ncbi:MAG: hypothetical protein IKY04_07515 [Lachnospiraceae bacterium]|nr:hypothetical protein [Lachnospiraceae bacterium]MBR4994084.1 hypothetical protein [Lachnospiraceae bacterium]MBR5944812.1 hypothetical protein [Lachnospiraceae bacterium]
MSGKGNRECNKSKCDNCICMTCQHQGFDCECEKENSGPITSCEDYDEMMGEQIKLNF